MVRGARTRSCGTPRRRSSGDRVGEPPRGPPADGTRACCSSYGLAKVPRRCSGGLERLPGGAGRRAWLHDHDVPKARRTEVDALGDPLDSEYDMFVMIRSAADSAGGASRSGGPGRNGRTPNAGRKARLDLWRPWWLEPEGARSARTPVPTPDHPGHRCQRRLRPRDHRSPRPPRPRGRRTRRAGPRRYYRPSWFVPADIRDVDAVVPRHGRLRRRRPLRLGDGRQFGDPAERVINVDGTANVLAAMGAPARAASSSRVRRRPTGPVRADRPN